MITIIGVAGSFATLFDFVYNKVDKYSHAELLENFKEVKNDLKMLTYTLNDLDHTIKEQGVWYNLRTAIVVLLQHIVYLICSLKIRYKKKEKDWKGAKWNAPPPTNYIPLIFFIDLYKYNYNI